MAASSMVDSSRVLTGRPLCDPSLVNIGCFTICSLPVGVTFALPRSLGGLDCEKTQSALHNENKSPNISTAG
jgi:hypothetical protein